MPFARGGNASQQIPINLPSGCAPALGLPALELPRLRRTVLATASLREADSQELFDRARFSEEDRTSDLQSGLLGIGGEIDDSHARIGLRNSSATSQPDTSPPKRMSVTSTSMSL